MYWHPWIYWSTSSTCTCTNRVVSQLWLYLCKFCSCWSLVPYDADSEMDCCMKYPYFTEALNNKPHITFFEMGRWHFAKEVHLILKHSFECVNNNKYNILYWTYLMVTETNISIKLPLPHIHVKFMLLI